LEFCANIDDEGSGTCDDKIRKAFIKPCAAPNCNGMLNSSYVCGVCNTKVCPNCFQIKRLKNEQPTSEHECKEEDIQTVLLIKKETKSCPKCAASIYKVEGCHQMWCTNCNTAFDWKTGQAINGVIHNPHFFEWQRNQNKQLAQQSSQGCLWPNELRTDLPILNLCIEQSAWRPVGNFVRIVFHMLDWATPRRYDLLNLQTRIQYILGEITEEKFAEKVYTMFKTNRFETNKLHIVQMLYQAGQTLVNNLSRLPSPEVKLIQTQELITSLTNLATYFNKCMTDHHKMHKSVKQFYLIEDNFEIRRTTVK
jgi:hypothetical protein